MDMIGNIVYIAFTVLTAGNEIIYTLHLMDFYCLKHNKSFKRE